MSVLVQVAYCNTGYSFNVHIFDTFVICNVHLISVNSNES